ncbi:hypothetical protein [Paraburkholderia metrosideri]|jgi:hypothetical protein|uniref:Heme exporter protein D n=1 Tax=Paraburkholderia metrosideri TaxID=580937 RepID=A0ABN7HTR0_9BURK|nr:hypothetical protein [Paraburkholderia metrosideri]CAD6534437.1 hypothetical protein LMG28140_02792 [Paraburkholderia metrosideri]
MADQDWVMAGVYLVGLVSTLLLMSALSARATKTRAEASRSTPASD